MALHCGDGSSVVRFTSAYFMWLKNQVFTIEDFPYAGIDFRGDPEMSLPLGEHLEESSKQTILMFLI